MRVKFIAPGVLPGDYVTADLVAVPRKEETVLIASAGDEKLLTVKSVVWPIAPLTTIAHHADADMPEVICERTADAEPACCCRFLAADECCGPCSTGRHSSCVGPLTPLPERI